MYTVYIKGAASASPEEEPQSLWRVRSRWVAVMAVVYSKGNNESIDTLILRFKNAVEKDGILNDYKRKKYFISASRIRHERNCRLRFLRKKARKERESKEPLRRI